MSSRMLWSICSRALKVLRCGAERLRQVLDRSRELSLKLSREECPFRVSEVHYVNHNVNHVLSTDSVEPNPQKFEVIIARPTPAKREDLPQRFLDVVTYLSKFIPNMSQKSAPLLRYSRKMLNGTADK